MSRTRIAAVLALAVLFGACSKDPEVAKREFAASGDAYVQQKKYAEAVIEYRNAIQQDPRFGEARLKLAEAYAELKQPEAFREYIRAADLLPDNSDLQIRVGRMLLVVGQFEDAQGRADRVIARNPKDVQARLLKGAALAGMKNLDEAITQVEAAIQEEPAGSAAHVNLATLEFARGNTQEAETEFKRAVELDPKSTPARLALANFYWIAKRPTEAEALLKDIYASEPANMEVNRTLSGFYIGTGRAVEAERHLKAMADASGNDNDKIALSMYYIGMKRRPEGMSLLESVASGDGDPAATAKVRLAALAATERRPADARRLVDEALKKQPKHAVALLAKSEMLLLDAKPDDALAVLAAVDDRNATKQLLVGRIHSLKGEPLEAIKALNEALRLNPRLVPAQMELARANMASGNLDDALQTAQAVAKAQPQSLDAQLLLARAYLVKRDVDGAEVPLQALMGRAPKSAAVQAAFGRLQILKKNSAEARKAFERSIAIDPNHAEAIAGLNALDLQAGQPAAARDRMDRRVAKDPKDPDTLMLAARTYFAIRDFTAAERTLRTVIDTDPARLAAYAQLGQVYAAQNRMDDARAEFQQVAEKRPTDVGPPTLVGMIYQSQNKIDQAKTWYEKALAINDKAPVAANNLAWVLAETGGNLDVALQLAQTSKAGLPNVAEIDDTLGWIYYKKGLTTLAIRAFQAGLEKDPNNASYHYHLGLAYINNQETQKARQSLEQALSLKLNPQDSAGAQKALSSLKG